MTHTPGPWKAETEYECAVYAHNNQMKIADIRGYGYLTGKGLGGMGLPDEEAKKIQNANARLIAAAPEMADKLKEIVNALDTINDFNSILFGGMGGPLRIHPKILDEAKVLLRRIEGDDPE